MLKIGITGGIGSGKSTICKLFSNLYSVPIFNTDEEAKKLYLNPDVKLKVIKLLGSECYINNEPNRKFIASKIFNDINLKESLTNILYPLLWSNLDKWCLEQKSNYILIETALLFETNTQNKFDKIILVYSDLETRIQRVINRDSCSREDVFNRIKHFIPEEDKIELSDIIIYNNNQSLEDQISKINIKLNG
jgi:dephospho-CoA kinase